MIVDTPIMHDCMWAAHQLDMDLFLNWVFNDIYVEWIIKNKKKNCSYKNVPFLTTTPHGWSNKKSRKLLHSGSRPGSLHKHVGRKNGNACNVFNAAKHFVTVTVLQATGTGPHTRGITSNIAEHDGSSKHNWRANTQLKIDIPFLPYFIVWFAVIVDGIICVNIVGCVGWTGSGFGGDEYTVSQHSRSGNSLDNTKWMHWMNNIKQ